MQDMLSSEFKIGAGGSVAAGPVGRQAQASTDWKFKSEVLMYSRARGAYAGLDLSGAVIKTDFDSTVAFYGKQIPTNVILSGRGPSNPNAAPFLNSSSKRFRKRAPQNSPARTGGWKEPKSLPLFHVPGQNKICWKGRV